MPLRSWFLPLALSTVAVVSAAEKKVEYNYDEAKVPAYTLPDPLVLNNGTRVRDAATWTAQRRPELLELFAREVYGRTPAGKTDKMHWAVTSRDNAALGGKAVRKEVTIWFTEKKEGPKLTLLIYQPKAAAKAGSRWPAFLGYNFNGNTSVHSDPGITPTKAWMRANAEAKIVNNRVTEATRGTSAAKWDVENVVARGYATVTAYYGEVSEDRAEGLTRDVATLFATNAVEQRRPDEWGSIGIWAWGLSRAMDYLQSDPDIDGRRVAVHGHSRLGKAALWAGAQDERFALVISNESGCGGAALSMRCYGETVARINSSFPFWFAKSFRAYNDREGQLPVDQHQLIALMAPRPVYVASAVEDQWADPKGEFLGAKHAEPVYALFGKKGLGVKDHPAVNQPVLGDGLAYHMRSGKHDVTPYDWAQYLNFADRVLKK